MYSYYFLIFGKTCKLCTYRPLIIILIQLAHQLNIVLSVDIQIKYNTQRHITIWTKSLFYRYQFCEMSCHIVEEDVMFSPVEEPLWI
jgi:hypothetical protein